MLILLSKQVLLIPPRGGSNPPAPANQSHLVETNPSRVVMRGKPAVYSTGCGHVVHRRAPYLVSVTTELGLKSWRKHSASFPKERRKLLRYV
jgi:hypothetical protein